MSATGAENGTTHEDLVQRVARLEGAVDCRCRRHRPWWMCWVMVWLVFGAIHSFGWYGWGGRSWGMAWPTVFLLFVAVMYFVRERRDAQCCGGKR